MSFNERQKKKQLDLLKQQSTGIQHEENDIAHEDIKLDQAKDVLTGQREPADPFSIAYAITIFMGVGLIIPWNATITAFDFLVNRVIPFSI